MERTMGILKVSVVVLLLSVGTVLAGGNSPLQPQDFYIEPQETQVQVLEVLPASEVEYVEGPLAPLYDFLIQRRLFKFCKLLRDANLEDVLQGLGGYWTLFVPTDASFIYLPGGTLENLKSNPQLLRDFILYHFTTGDFTTSQILNEMLVDSVQGAPLRFNVYGQIITVSGAHILEPDLQFDLGRIHIIDHPLYPIPTTDIVSYLRTSHQRLYRLLLDANLVDYISSGTVTILAPEDDAFDSLSVDLKDALTSNRTLAERILLNHVLPGSVYTGGITDGMQLETVSGEVITFTTRRGLIFANGIPIVLPDVPFTNGVIQVLNRVLLPDGIEAECNCKPTSENSPRQPAPGSPARTRSPFNPTPRTPSFQTPTTRRPSQQSHSRQTPQPFNRQTPSTFQSNRPANLQTVAPRLPVPQPQRPSSPARTGQPPRPIPSPVQITRSPFDRSDILSQPEDDLNAVSGPTTKPITSQKRPEHSRTTRYPPPPRRIPPPQVPAQPPQIDVPENNPENNNFPEQDIPNVITNPPRQTSRWVNRQPTQAPRFPTPARSTFRTPATTGRQPAPGTHIRITPPPIGKIPQQNIRSGQTSTTPSSQTQQPAIQTQSWNQRQQVTRTTRQPTQQRTTQRSPQIPAQPQRRTTQRPIGLQTNAPLLPQPTESPFESNRQRPNCRPRGSVISPSTQNLPICPDSEILDPCQNLPYNPSDPRPMCPNDILTPGCRNPSDPFNPSDTRPLCPSVPGQGCRSLGQPTYIGDRRPICSPTPPNQVGCRDPSTPFSTTDNRPLCSTSSNPPSPSPQRTQPETCRQSNEPQDGRPLCPNEPEENCRPFLERPKAGDRRPVCKVNRQQPTVHDSTKGQRPVPQHRPTYPQAQNNRYPNSQTTRRPSWQTTTRLPDIAVNQVTPGQQQHRNIPPTRNLRPLPSPGPIPQPRPQPGLRQPPSQPQTPVQPQTGSRPSSFDSNPPSSGQRTQSPPSQTVAPQGFVPSSPPRSRPQPQGPYPQLGITNAPFSRQPIQTPSLPPNQPNVPTSSVRPGSQPFAPQRRPITTPRQQIAPVTGRVTSSPRAPISVTGTSTTPGEDSRRSLYEIVEDPSLLIRGHPVKLTKIFSLFHKAGIEDILSGPGPTTVFLPSDDAFATLPKGVVEQLEENPELLRQVLLYHVANVEILPSAQGESYTVPSLEGDQLVITMLNGGRLILISGAKAIAVTRANNGIFYVINQFLYPLPHQNIVGAIQSRPDLSTLAWLLPMSGLAELLQGQAPYTFLAPTDTAFAQLPPAVYDELTQNTTALQEVLLNHIIEGAHYGREFLTGGTFPSARGGKLKFQVVSYGYQVNEVNIKTPEIVTGTGVIHLIDQVLLEDPDLRYFRQFDNSLNRETSTNAPPTNEIQPFIRPTQPSGPRSGTIPSNTGQSLNRGHHQPGQQGGQRVNGHRTPVPQVQQPQGRTPNTSPQSPQSGQHPLSNQSPHSGQRPSSNQSPHNGQRTSPNQSPPTGQRTPTGQSPNRAPSGQHFGQRQPNTPSQTLPVGQNDGNQQANVADLARAMGLNRFANWVTNTGLLEKIHDGGVYTVFAPTDDAVNSLPQDMVNSIDSNPQQTKSLLMYHIIPRRINLNSISNDETSSTLLQGKSIRFNVYPTVQPNCKQLVTASGTPIGDALATMGSVQVIPVTQVLYQPTGNLLNIIDSSPILQELSQAIKSARLSWILSGSGPLTFFAPSDTAFQSLTPEERQTLIDDKQAFSDLLKRHLIRGTYFSSGVQEDLQKNSEGGQPMAISLQEGILTINSVPVAYSDITSTNGVLHVIDQFL